MLALTRKTEYALIAMSHLSHESNGCSSAREIATHYGIPLALLMNVLKQLAQAGLAQSARGPHGGYALAKPAGEISLMEIFRAIEGPVHLVNCAGLLEQQTSAEAENGKKRICEIMRSCPVGASIRKVDAKLVRFLEELTLVDVCENPRTVNIPSFAEAAGE